MKHPKSSILVTNFLSDDGSDDGGEDGGSDDEDEDDYEENSLELDFGGLKVEMNLNEFHEQWSFEE